MSGPDTNVRQEQRAQTKVALSVMIVPLFFVIGFAACIIGAYHKPHPNGIKIGVVAPAAQVGPLLTGLQKAAGSAFDISSASTVAEAVDKVRHRDLNAAFVAATNPKQPGTVVVASANGRLVATAAETLARSVTVAQGAPLTVRDVRPLTSGDEIGLGVFLFMIVCTICGYIAPTVLETATPALRPARRYAVLAGTATLVAALAYLIGGLGYGVYKGSVGTILAFIGVGALYAFVMGLGTRLFQVLFGPPGIFLSLALLVFLNVASLGATYTSPVLAPFWKFLNHFWVGAGAVNAERSILYFGGRGVGTDMLRLLVWTVVIVALLLLPASRKLERQRERSVDAVPASPVGAAV